MIIVLDSRRPSSLGVDVNLRLEAFLGMFSALGFSNMSPWEADSPASLAYIVPSPACDQFELVVCKGDKQSNLSESPPKAEYILFSPIYY